MTEQDVPAAGVPDALRDILNSPIETAAASKSSASNQSSASLQSSSSKESSRPASSHPAPGKYKEKRRPEPLDLSVKSAGIFPSGMQLFTYDLSRSSTGSSQQVLSAPHNNVCDASYYLPRATLINCSTNSSSTLETPKFVWNDPSEAMIKTRHFSSSSQVAANKPSRHELVNGAHLSSSLAGDSPPMTPSTPNSAHLISLMSPGSSRFLANAQHPAGSPVSSYQAAAAAVLMQHQQHLKPSMVALSPHLVATSFFMQQQQQALSGAGRAPRRSSSSDNLSNLAKQQSPEGKKNAISPLAIKNLSSTSPSLNGTRSRFSYAPADPTLVSRRRELKSPIINVTGESQSSSDLQPSSSSNSNSNSNSAASVAPSTPTSLSAATTNLLNIKLNSPHVRVSAEEPASTNGQQAVITLGELFLPTCPPADSAKRSPNSHLSTGQATEQRLMPTPSLAYLSIGHSNHGSSGTLDTPTLISPSQLRANSSTSSICFLPSPTLSPMSATFELPSPFAFPNLVGVTFAPPASSQRSNGSDGGQPASDATESKVSSEPALDGDQTGEPPPPPPPQGYPEPAAREGADLVHLVTSARDKVGSHVDCAEEEAMEVDQCAPQAIPRIYVPDEHHPQPYPVVDQQHVDYPGLANKQQQQRNQRELAAKRALSPGSFQARVNQYMNERIESSSAPPNGFLARARSRLKVASGSDVWTVPGEQLPGGLLQPGAPPSQRASYSEINQHWPASCSTLQPNQHPYCRNSMERSSSAEPALLGANLDTTPGPYQAQLQQVSRSAQYLPRAEHLSGPHPVLIGASGYECCALGSISDQQLHRAPPTGLDYAAPCQLPATSLAELQNNLAPPHYHMSAQQIPQPSPAGARDNPPEVEPQRQQRALSADPRQFGARPAANCNSSSLTACSGDLQPDARSHSAGSGPKKYHCDRCSKSFTRSDMLTRHKRLHSGDRPFKCDECKQEFSRSDHLSTHMRTHTGEKPYKCELCSYSACRKDMITRHMKVHSRSSPSAANHSSSQ